MGDGVGNLDSGVGSNSPPMQWGTFFCSNENSLTLTKISFPWFCWHYFQYVLILLLSVGPRLSGRVYRAQITLHLKRPPSLAAVAANGLSFQTTIHESLRSLFPKGRAKFQSDVIL